MLSVMCTWPARGRTPLTETQFFWDDSDFCLTISRISPGTKPPRRYDFGIMFLFKQSIKQGYQTMQIPILVEEWLNICLNQSQ